LFIFICFVVAKQSRRDGPDARHRFKMVRDRKRAGPRGYARVPSLVKPEMAKVAAGIANNVRTTLGRPLNPQEMSSVEDSVARMFRAKKNERSKFPAMAISAREKRRLANAVRRSSLSASRDERGGEVTPAEWSRFLADVRKGYFWRPPPPIFDEDKRDKLQPEPGLDSPEVRRRALRARLVNRKRAQARSKRARAAALRKRALSDDAYAWFCF
jgi:hypothetical protein